MLVLSEQTEFRIGVDLSGMDIVGFSHLGIQTGDECSLRINGCELRQVKHEVTERSVEEGGRMSGIDVGENLSVDL